MAGMQTKLHLYSSHIGTYEGLNTQLNGEGFSDMHFPTYIIPKKKFSVWLKGIKAKPNPLTLAQYSGLYRPTTLPPVTYYSSIPDNLFMKF